MSEALRKALRYGLQSEAGENTMSGGGGENTMNGGGGDSTMKGAAGADEGLGTVEDQARRMGWVPQEEFRGDKAKWTDAGTFVKNGLESLPILRERNRTLQRTNDDLLRSVGEFKKMSDDNFAKGYAKAKRELEAEIAAKAKAGDAEGATKAATELAELEGQKAKHEAAAQEDPVFNGWVGQNAWYSDPEMRLEADGEAFKLRASGEKAEGVAFLDKVKEKMKARFPDKFTNPRRDPANGGGNVERPSGGGDGGNRGKKGWDQLPADAKEAGERYIKQKLYKGKAEYAEAYFAQN